MTEQPITQAQDHDRRLGRLEGIAEQLTDRLDRIERTLDAIRQEQRQESAAVRQELAAVRQEQRQESAAVRQEQRRDFRWLIGIQLTTLIALGTLILLRLPG